VGLDYYVIVGDCILNNHAYEAGDLITPADLVWVLNNTQDPNRWITRYLDGEPAHIKTQADFLKEESELWS